MGSGRGWVVAACAVVPLLLTPNMGSAQGLSWSGSLQYGRGTFIFTEPTETWSFYNSLSLRGSRARITVGLPVLRQDSRAITWIGLVPVPTGGPDHGSVERRREGEDVPMKRREGSATGHGGGNGGPGALLAPSAVTTDTIEALVDGETSVADPAVYGAYEVWKGPGAVRSLELTGSVKVPINDLDSGVGTGEWDYSLGASAVFGAGRTLVFTDVSWWVYGDLPGLELDDGIS